MVSLFLLVLNPINPLLGYNNNPIAHRVSMLAGQDYFLLTNCFLCPLYRVNDKVCGKHYQGSNPWIICQLPEFVQQAFPGMFLTVCRTRQSHF
jgi:hypothetical protein